MRLTGERRRTIYKMTEEDAHLQVSPFFSVSVSGQQGPLFRYKRVPLCRGKWIAIRFFRRSGFMSASREVGRHELPYRHLLVLYRTGENAMKKIASLTLLVATLLFSISAISSETCPEVSRAASKAAQDYRQAVGKVRTACDSSFEECSQSRALADQMLAILIAANDAVSAACTFVNPNTDDALPVTPETVAAAIDTLPLSVLIPCQAFDTGQGLVEVGCPSGWVLNIPRTLNAVTPLTADSFSFSLNVNASGSIPIRYGVASCSLTVGTLTGVPVLGTATFSSSVVGGTVNRLQLAATSISTASLNFSGCFGFDDIVNFIAPFVHSSIEQLMIVALTRQFCGATGPELFGACP